MAILALRSPWLFAGDAWKTAPFLLEGDSIAGIGAVAAIEQLAVNDRRTRALLVRTDHVPEADTVLLVDGAVRLREGQAGGALERRPCCGAARSLVRT